jgi:uncharacterized protein (DUF433 family)
MPKREDMRASPAGITGAPATGNPIEGGPRICNFPRPRRFKGRGRMTTAPSEFWRERLTVPSYRVFDAARYARTTSQTIRNWEHTREAIVSKRDEGEGLSYLQLIEVGVVAAMRKRGVTLRRIKDAREYLCAKFKHDYPFAHYRFKTDGKKLVMDYDQIVQSDKNKLLELNENGQLAWTPILAALLHEFEYEADIDTVLRWRVAGADNPIIIDPRIAFGAPHVNGIATWVLRERWKSGESLADIAEDYDLPANLVFSALQFEHVDIDLDRPDKWTHYISLLF